MSDFKVGDIVKAAETDVYTEIVGEIVAIQVGTEYPYQVRVDGECALYSFAADELTLLLRKEFLN